MKTAYTYELGTYARFYSLDEARALILLLESNDIPFKITRERNQLDSLIIGGPPEPMIVLWLPPERFQEVNLLVQDSIDGIAPDRKLHDYDSADFAPEKLKSEWIVLGYLLSIFALIGIFIGMTLINSSKRLPDGQKVKLYDQKTIMHGRYMLITGVIFTLLWLGRKIYISFIA